MRRMASAKERQLSRIESYTNEQLLSIFNASKSMTEFANKLGYKSRSSLGKKNAKIRLEHLNIRFKYVNYSITDNIILDMAKTCESITALMKALGLKPNGYAHKRFTLRCEALGIVYNTQRSHSWNKGKKYTKTAVDDYLNNCVAITPYKLKYKLLAAGLINYKCELCQINAWQGRPLNLQLDHIDGNRLNNNLINLRLLCPNCHSQTPTFARIKK